MIVASTVKSLFLYTSNNFNVFIRDMVICPIGISLSRRSRRSFKRCLYLILHKELKRNEHKSYIEYYVQIQIQYVCFFSATYNNFFGSPIHVFPFIFLFCMYVVKHFILVRLSFQYHFLHNKINHIYVSGHYY